MGSGVWSVTRWTRLYGLYGFPALRMINRAVVLAVTAPIRTKDDLPSGNEARKDGAKDGLTGNQRRAGDGDMRFYHVSNGDDCGTPYSHVLSEQDLVVPISTMVLTRSVISLIKCNCVTSNANDGSPG